MANDERIVVLKTQKNGFLTKDIENIRKKIRQFYLYGYKSYAKNITKDKDLKFSQLIETEKGNSGKKSIQTVRNEEAMIRHWLKQPNKLGRKSKSVLQFEEIMSVDVHSERHNPFFRVWKHKSFSNQKISFHFYLLDIMEESKNQGLPATEVCNRLIDKMPSTIADENNKPRKIDTKDIQKKDSVFDVRTIQNYLKEYKDCGIVTSFNAYHSTSGTDNRVKKPHYKLAYSPKITNAEYDAISFFAEVAPCGVVGSFIMDRFVEPPEDILLFKHHYITNTLDAGVLEILLEAIQEKRVVSLHNYNSQHYNPKTGKYTINRIEVVPMKIFASAQNGRQYLMALQVPEKENRPHNYASFRLDNIFGVEKERKYPKYDEEMEYFKSVQKNMWGVTYKPSKGIKTVSVDLQISDDEYYVYKRLISEKRTGTVTQIDENLYRFSTDVYDVAEMIPWIRMFIGRIVNINISDPYDYWNTNFNEDLKKMYAMYGIGGEEL